MSCFSRYLPQKYANVKHKPRIQSVRRLHHLQLHSPRPSKSAIRSIAYATSAIEVHPEAILKYLIALLLPNTPKY